jgi:hypothetical protein
VLPGPPPISRSGGAWPMWPPPLWPPASSASRSAAFGRYGQIGGQCGAFAMLRPLAAMLEAPPIRPPPASRSAAHAGSIGPKASKQARQSGGSTGQASAAAFGHYGRFRYWPIAPPPASSASRSARIGRQSKSGGAWPNMAQSSAASARASAAASRSAAVLGLINLLEAPPMLEAWQSGRPCFQVRPIFRP